MRRYRRAVIIIARYRAKQAVREQIRARGQKIAQYSCREIAEQAEAYMAQHLEELIAKSVADCLTFPEFARYRSEIDVASVCKATGNRTLPDKGSDNLRTNQQ